MAGSRRVVYTYYSAHPITQFLPKPHFPTIGKPTPFFFSGVPTPGIYFRKCPEFWTGTPILFKLVDPPLNLLNPALITHLINQTAV